MRYLGGKAMIAKRLCAEIAKYRAPGQTVWEPFCGGLNSASRHGGSVIATDASVPLMALLEAVRDGWDPPSTITEAEWRAWRELPETDPRHGFAKFGCSFRGVPGGSYCFHSGWSSVKSNPEAAREALLRDVPRIEVLRCIDFFDVEIGSSPWRDCLIYCDPPYRGRTGYGFPFDHRRFAEAVRRWAAYTTVLVSEYQPPEDHREAANWHEIWSHKRAAMIRGREKTHIEHLYLVTP